jgi:hypothetical protein
LVERLIGPERARLRTLVNEAVRARLAAVAVSEGGQAKLCAGCGMPYDDTTRGCRTCWDRMRRRTNGRGVKVHGTASGATHGCKCEPCRVAYNAYKREYVAARARKAAWEYQVAEARRLQTGS